MSTGPGKIEITGIVTINGSRVFVLRFLQSRDLDCSFRPFFAEYDDAATWLDDLKPAFGEPAFFFASPYHAMLDAEHDRPALHPAIAIA